MSPSLKAVLLVALMFSGVVSLSLWVLPEAHPDMFFWMFRGGLSIVTVVLSWVVVRDMRRKEILPDQLRGVASNYFEHDGLCFAFVPVISGNFCWMQIFFQNRYANFCRGRIVLQAPLKSLSFTRLPLSKIDVEIGCDGGAFGVARIPWPIPMALQGKQVQCEVGADTTYDAGRGKLLRFRAGLRVRSLAVLALSSISLAKPARVTLRLPTDVSEEAPADAELTQEILWRADLPTGGFPISAAALPNDPANDGAQ